MPTRPVARISYIAAIAMRPQILPRVSLVALAADALTTIDGTATIKRLGVNRAGMNAITSGGLSLLKSGASQRNHLALRTTGKKKAAGKPRAPRPLHPEKGSDRL
jgi:hypothetical protein